jgi:guanine deaminase
VNDTDAMARAIVVCRIGLSRGQSPFGAVILKDGRSIAEAHNTVRLDNDPTAHAEINAIRSAAQVLGSFDLSGCTLYSTCEPCPMCLAATHWSRIDRLVFGASISDAQSAGFREMPISAEAMVKMGESPLRVERRLHAEECKRLFDEWKAAGHANAY